MITCTSLTQFSWFCSIDLAREDKVVWKVTEAGLMAVLIASGLTFGSTLVLESDRLRMSKRGRKVVEKA